MLWALLVTTNHRRGANIRQQHEYLSAASEQLKAKLDVFDPPRVDVQRSCRVKAGQGGRRQSARHTPAHAERATHQQQGQLVKGC